MALNLADKEKRREDCTSKGGMECTSACIEGETNVGIRDVQILV